MGENNWVCGYDEQKFVLYANGRAHEAMSLLWSELLIHCIDENHQLKDNWREILIDRIFLTYSKNNGNSR